MNSKRAICRFLFIVFGYMFSTQGCAKVPLSKATPVSIAAPSTPSLSPITLDSINDGQTVPCENTVQGTYSEKVIEPIWLVVLVENMWFPQDAKFQPVSKINGKWSGLVRFGPCTDPEGDSGKDFQLLVIRAPEECHQQFDDYFDEGHRTGNWPGIPDNEAHSSCKENIAIAISVTRD